MKAQRSWILGSCDRTRQSKDEKREGSDWPVPRSVKEVQKFWRLANYYRQFVKDFTRIAKPLHEMTRKDVKWNWGERQQKVFEKLKERFITEPVLVIPDLNKEMRVEVDVLDFATSRVLLIKCGNEK